MARPKRPPPADAAPESPEVISVRKSPRKRTPSGEPSQHEPPKRGRPPKSRDASAAKAAPSHTIARRLDPAGTPDLSVDSGKARVLGRSSAPLAVSEDDITRARTPHQLAEYVSSLVSTQQDALFEQYRQTAQLQQAADADLIAELRLKLDKKEATIESLVSQLAHGQPPVSTPKKPAHADMYQSPIRKRASQAAMIHRDDLADELKTISFTFDMLELLTGVRIVNYEDDKDKFYFDVKQASAMGDDAEPVAIEYRLVIKRKFDQTAEVTYIPAFLSNLKKRAKDAEQEAKNRDAARVAKHLPEYLQDNLKFPYNTLSQFYTKLGKALNKAAKS